MDSDYKDSVLAYFRAKASTYDLVEEQVYWEFSDALLWRCLLRYALDSRSSGFSFLDAGGGTGRWSFKVLDYFTEAQGVLLDISESMMDQAREKLLGTRVGRLKLIPGDLDDLPASLHRASFDVIWNFHNVLGFVEDPSAVILALAKQLRPGGQLISFVPNALHAAYFNVLTNRLAEARSALETRITSFTPDMPAIRAFTPRSLREIYEAAGLQVQLLTGFPSLVYPALQETLAQGSSDSRKEHS
ncbi:MAG: class I SAM-dependent methyltransferase [Pseudonocardiaceae bacterium]